jgi:hypothetical protein
MCGCDWVVHRTEVFRRVPVLRRVAAADVTARPAEAQVDPLVADLQAVLAAVGARLDVADLGEVRAGVHFPKPITPTLVIPRSEATRDLLILRGRDPSLRSG